MSESLGPVSQACAAELRELARQRGIVVWLDREGSYTELADVLAERHDAGDFNVPVVGFRGSYLETLLALEGLEDGASMAPLVLHVPGLTEDDMRTTPLLEMYRAGKRHRRALPTLVREAAHGIAAADDIEAFIGQDGLTLAAADQWLASYRAGQRGAGPDLSLLDAQALFEALRRDGSLADKAGQSEVREAVAQRAAELVGMPKTWHAGEEDEPTALALSGLDRASRLASRLAEWVMCVEFVDDLKRSPVDEELVPLGRLAKPFVQASRELAAYLRARHPDFYVARADELEAGLREHDHATAADLGKIDTFRFEDEKVLAAGLEAIEAGRFDEALDSATLRTDGRSFWTQRDPRRRLAWHFVELSAQLGRAIAAAEKLLAGCSSIEEAAARYAASGHVADRYHRHLEQLWQQASLRELAEFSALRQGIDAMRGRYRAWADAIAVDFNRLCQTHGFLPTADLQQRRLFDEVVQPFASEDGVTAYFLVDALRYEMGAQLVEAMAAAGGGDIDLRHRLAELPSITEVGMNVLAPVADGSRLVLDVDDKIQGFRAGEARVSSPDGRCRAMQLRVGGDTCPSWSLKELLDKEVSSLRKSLTRARLAVVHCEGIDKAGEKGVGLTVFESELQNLRAAWRRLHEAGVKRFVITADHGFLLHDATTRNPKRHGKKTTPNRRHVISELATDHDGEVRVSSTELGYEGKEVHFLFPEDAAPFDNGKKAKDFVHGGNSLQERVIPVITVQHRHKAGGDISRYRFEAQVQPPLAGMHCVRARVIHDGQTAMLAFGGRQEVEVTLQCTDAATCQLEIIDVRDAQHHGNVIRAAPESWFEIYFRVVSQRDERVRVRLAHATGAAAFEALTLAEHFDAELPPPPAKKSEQDEAEPEVEDAEPATPAELSWLDELPAGGVRRVFQHLAEHGTINEDEATAMLGGPRKFRAFSRKLEDYVRLAPFRVRVDTASGGKCYVRGER